MMFFKTRQFTKKLNIVYLRLGLRLGLGLGLESRLSLEPGKGYD